MAPGQGSEISASITAAPLWERTVGNALVVQKTRLPQSQSALRAAQYVRMSTVHQKYSTQNQAAAIAIFAARHNLAIVRTYEDDGKSGLKIDKRAGLKQLIADIYSGRTDFSHVLVYDVSRLGQISGHRRKRTMNSSADKRASWWNTAPNSSTTTAVCYQR
jgi:hypothetical protein